MNPEMRLTIENRVFNLDPSNTYIACIKNNHILDHLVHVEVVADDSGKLYKFFRELFEKSGEDYDYLVEEMARVGYQPVIFHAIPPSLIDEYVDLSLEALPEEYKALCAENGLG